MSLITLLVFFALVIFAIGYWWRTRSLACPSYLTLLLDNPFMNGIAGPDKLFRRMRLQKGMRVLDVGSGPGRISIPAAEFIGDSGEVVALDIQQKMLDKLEIRADARGMANIKMINAGAGSGMLPNAYFERALLVTVLGEIPNKPDALLEIYHALQDGGILSITEVIPDPHYTSQTRVRRLCLDAGFDELDFFGNRFAFTINFIKPGAR